MPPIRSLPAFFPKINHSVTNKVLVVAACASIAICLTGCRSMRKTTYALPDDLDEEQKHHIVETLDKGKRLYRTYCAECHGIFTKGKPGVENFSQHQIDMYTANFIRRDPKNHAVAAKMSGDQLKSVFLFIKSIKRNPTGAIDHRK